MKGADYNGARRNSVLPMKKPGKPGFFATKNY
jgi:hypothetical protein